MFKYIILYILIKNWVTNLTKKFIYSHVFFPQLWVNIYYVHFDKKILLQIQCKGLISPLFFVSYIIIKIINGPSVCVYNHWNILLLIFAF